MTVTELIKHLEECKAEYGDVGVCLAQLQSNGKTVRLTGITRCSFGVHGVLFLTNMNQSEVEKHLDI